MGTQKGTIVLTIPHMNPTHGKDVPVAQQEALECLGLRVQAFIRIRNIITLRLASVYTELVLSSCVAVERCGSRW